MPNISSFRTYRIIKSCGDNAGTAGIMRWHPDGGGHTNTDYGPDGPVHHFLVEPQTSYFERWAAEKRAQELAVANPGSRYYVFESVSCFLASAPKVERKDYR